MYHFKCQGCDAQYIGESMKHPKTAKPKIYNRNEKMTVSEFFTIKGNLPNSRVCKIYEANVKIKCEKSVIKNQTEDFDETLKLFDVG